jgi:hypothetical protein
MSLEKIADTTIKKLVREMKNLDFTDEQLAELRSAIEGALTDAVDVSAVQFREATMFCCGPERDLAHQINEEVDRRTQVLIANLNYQR